MAENGSSTRELNKRHRSTSKDREHRHHRSHRDGNEKKHRHSSPKRSSKSPEPKRRQPDEITKVK
ncbi:unnamed protein product, partial [Adineta steineri]